MDDSNSDSIISNISGITLGGLVLLVITFIVVKIIKDKNSKVN